MASRRQHAPRPHTIDPRQCLPGVKPCAPRSTTEASCSWVGGMHRHTQAREGLRQKARQTSLQTSFVGSQSRIHSPVEKRSEEIPGGSFTRFFYTRIPSLRATYCEIMELTQKRIDTPDIRAPIDQLRCPSSGRAP